VNNLAMAGEPTLGVDVSDRFSSYCLLDKDGQVLEEGKLRTTVEALRRRFEGTDCRVIIEAGHILLGSVAFSPRQVMK
jgi:hypothetical protein